MQALRSNAHRREEIQLVVPSACAVLDVHRARLTGEVEQPADAKGEDLAVRLHRQALPPLEPVSGVVAAEERSARLFLRIEDERWDLLQSCSGVELTAKPCSGARNARQIKRFDRAFGVKAGDAGPLPGPPKEQLRPELC